jgi:hypothetical protein
MTQSTQRHYKPHEANVGTTHAKVMSKDITKTMRDSSSHLVNPINQGCRIYSFTIYNFYNLVLYNHPIAINYSNIICHSFPSILV